MADIEVTIGSSGSITAAVQEPTITILLPSGTQGDGSLARSASVMINGAEAGSAALSTGDSKAVLRIPAELNGMSLTGVAACAATPSSSGIIDIQVRRVRAGVSVDMLSTSITIDEGESDSTTAFIGAVIDSANDDVQTADQIHIDVDSAGFGALGVVVSLKFEII